MPLLRIGNHAPPTVAAQTAAASVDDDVQAFQWRSQARKSDRGSWKAREWSVTPNWTSVNSVNITIPLICAGATYTVEPPCIST
jgi:hypothetical protein